MDRDDSAREHKASSDKKLGGEYESKPSCKCDIISSTLDSKASPAAALEGIHLPECLDRWKIKDLLHARFGDETPLDDNSKQGSLSSISSSGTSSSIVGEKVKRFESLLDDYRKNIENIQPKRGRQQATPRIKLPSDKDAINISMQEIRDNKFDIQVEQTKPDKTAKNLTLVEESTKFLEEDKGPQIQEENNTVISCQAESKQRKDSEEVFHARHSSENMDKKIIEPTDIRYEPFFRKELPQAPPDRPARRCMTNSLSRIDSDVQDSATVVVRPPRRKSSVQSLVTSSPKSEKTSETHRDVDFALPVAGSISEINEYLCVAQCDASTPVLRPKRNRGKQGSTAENLPRHASFQEPTISGIKRGHGHVYSMSPVRASVSIMYLSNTNEANLPVLEKAHSIAGLTDNERKNFAALNAQKEMLQKKKKIISGKKIRKAFRSSTVCWPRAFKRKKVKRLDSHPMSQNDLEMSRSSESFASIFLDHDRKAFNTLPDGWKVGSTSDEIFTTDARENTEFPPHVLESSAKKPVRRTLRDKLLRPKILASINSTSSLDSVALKKAQKFLVTSLHPSGSPKNVRRSTVCFSTIPELNIQSNVDSIMESQGTIDSDGTASSLSVDKSENIISVDGPGVTDTNSVPKLSLKTRFFLRAASIPDMAPRIMKAFSKSALASTSEVDSPAKTTIVSTAESESHLRFNFETPADSIRHDDIAPELITAVGGNKSSFKPIVVHVDDSDHVKSERSNEAPSSREMSNAKNYIADVAENSEECECPEMTTISLNKLETMAAASQPLIRENLSAGDLSEKIRGLQETNFPPAYMSDDKGQIYDDVGMSTQDRIDQKNFKPGKNMSKSTEECVMKKNPVALSPLETDDVVDDAEFVGNGKAGIKMPDYPQEVMPHCAETACNDVPVITALDPRDSSIFDTTKDMQEVHVVADNATGVSTNYKIESYGKRFAVKILPLAAESGTNEASDSKSSDVRVVKTHRCVDTGRVLISYNAPIDGEQVSVNLLEMGPEEVAMEECSTDKNAGLESCNVGCRRYPNGGSGLKEIFNDLRPSQCSGCDSPMCNLPIITVSSDLGNVTIPEKLHREIAKEWILNKDRRECLKNRSTNNLLRASGRRRIRANSIPECDELNHSNKQPSCNIDHSPSLLGQKSDNILEVSASDDFFDFFRDRAQEEHYAHIIESDSDNEHECAVAAVEYLLNARRSSVDTLSSYLSDESTMNKSSRWPSIEVGSLAACDSNSRRDFLEEEHVEKIQDDVFDYFGDTSITEVEKSERSLGKEWCSDTKQTSKSTTSDSIRSEECESHDSLTKICENDSIAVIERESHSKEEISNAEAACSEGKRHDRSLIPSSASFNASNSLISHGLTESGSGEHDDSKAASSLGIKSDSDSVKLASGLQDVRIDREEVFACPLDDVGSSNILPVYTCVPNTSHEKRCKSFFDFDPTDDIFETFEDLPPPINIKGPETSAVTEADVTNFETTIAHSIDNSEMRKHTSESKLSNFHYEFSSVGSAMSSRIEQFDRNDQTTTDAPLDMEANSKNLRRFTTLAIVNDVSKIDGLNDGAVSIMKTEEIKDDLVYSPESQSSLLNKNDEFEVIKNAYPVSSSTNKSVNDGTLEDEDQKIGLSQEEEKVIGILRPLPKVKRVEVMSSSESLHHDVGLTTHLVCPKNTLSSSKMNENQNETTTVSVETHSERQIEQDQNDYTPPGSGIKSFEINQMSLHEAVRESNDDEEKRRQIGTLNSSSCSLIGTTTSSEHHSQSISDNLPVGVHSQTSDEKTHKNNIIETTNDTNNEHVTPTRVLYVDSTENSLSKSAYDDNDQVDLDDNAFVSSTDKISQDEDEVRDVSHVDNGLTEEEQMISVLRPPPKVKADRPVLQHVKTLFIKRVPKIKVTDSRRNTIFEVEETDDFYDNIPDQTSFMAEKTIENIKTTALNEDFESKLLACNASNNSQAASVAEKRPSLEEMNENLLDNREVQDSRTLNYANSSLDDPEVQNTVVPDEDFISVLRPPPKIEHKRTETSSEKADFRKLSSLSMSPNTTYGLSDSLSSEVQMHPKTECHVAESARVNDVSTDKNEKASMHNEAVESSPSLLKNENSSMPSDHIKETGSKISNIEDSKDDNEDSKSETNDELEYDNSFSREGSPQKIVEKNVNRSERRELENCSQIGDEERIICVLRPPPKIGKLDASSDLEKQNLALNSLTPDMTSVERNRLACFGESLINPETKISPPSCEHNKPDVNLESTSVLPNETEVMQELSEKKGNSASDQPEEMTKLLEHASRISESNHFCDTVSNPSNSRRGSASDNLDDQAVSCRDIKFEEGLDDNVFGKSLDVISNDDVQNLLTQEEQMISVIRPPPKVSADKPEPQYGETLCANLVPRIKVTDSRRNTIFEVEENDDFYDNVSDPTTRAELETAENMRTDKDSKCKSQSLCNSTLSKSAPVSEGSPTQEENVGNVVESGNVNDSLLEKLDNSLKIKETDLQNVVLHEEYFINVLRPSTKTKNWTTEAASVETAGRTVFLPSNSPKTSAVISNLFNYDAKLKETHDHANTKANDILAAYEGTKSEGCVDVIENPDVKPESPKAVQTALRSENILMPDASTASTEDAGSEKIKTVQELESGNGRLRGGHPQKTTDGDMEESKKAELNNCVQIDQEEQVISCLRPPSKVGKFSAPFRSEILNTDLNFLPPESTSVAGNDSVRSEESVNNPESKISLSNREPSTPQNKLEQSSILLNETEVVMEASVEKSNSETGLQEITPVTEDATRISESNKCSVNVNNPSGLRRRSITENLEDQWCDNNSSDKPTKFKGGNELKEREGDEIELIKISGDEEAVIGILRPPPKIKNYDAVLASNPRHSDEGLIPTLDGHTEFENNKSGFRSGNCNSMHEVQHEATTVNTISANPSEFTRDEDSTVMMNQQIKILKAATGPLNGRTSSSDYDSQSVTENHPVDVHFSSSDEITQQNNSITKPMSIEGVASCRERKEIDAITELRNAEEISALIPEPETLILSSNADKTSWSESTQIKNEEDLDYHTSGKSAGHLSNYEGETCENSHVPDVSTKEEQIISVLRIPPKINAKIPVSRDAKTLDDICVPKIKVTDSRRNTIFEVKETDDFYDNVADLTMHPGLISCKNIETNTVDEEYVSKSQALHESNCSQATSLSESIPLGEEILGNISETKRIDDIPPIEIASCIIPPENFIRAAEFSDKKGTTIDASDSKQESIPEDLKNDSLNDKAEKSTEAAHRNEIDVSAGEGIDRVNFEHSLEQVIGVLRPPPKVGKNEEKFMSGTLNLNAEMVSALPSHEKSTNSASLSSDGRTPSCKHVINQSAADNLPVDNNSLTSDEKSQSEDSKIKPINTEKTESCNDFMSCKNSQSEGAGEFINEEDKNNPTIKHEAETPVPENYPEKSKDESIPDIGDGGCEAFGKLTDKISEDKIDQWNSSHISEALIEEEEMISVLRPPPKVKCVLHSAVQEPVPPAKEASAIQSCSLDNPEDVCDAINSPSETRYPYSTIISSNTSTCVINDDLLVPAYENRQDKDAEIETAVVDRNTAGCLAKLDEKIGIGSCKVSAASNGMKVETPTADRENDPLTPTEVIAINCVPIPPSMKNISHTSACDVRPTTIQDICIDDDYTLRRSTEDKEAERTEVQDTNEVLLTEEQRLQEEVISVLRPPPKPSKGSTSYLQFRSVAGIDSPLVCKESHPSVSNLTENYEQKPIEITVTEVDSSEGRSACHGDNLKLDGRFSYDCSSEKLQSSTTTRSVSCSISSSERFTINTDETASINNVPEAHMEEIKPFARDSDDFFDYFQDFTPDENCSASNVCLGECRPPCSECHESAADKDATSAVTLIRDNIENKGDKERIEYNVSNDNETDAITSKISAISACDMKGLNDKLSSEEEEMISVLRPPPKVCKGQFDAPQIGGQTETNEKLQSPCCVAKSAENTTCATETGKSNENTTLITETITTATELETALVSASEKTKPDDSTGVDVNRCTVNNLGLDNYKSNAENEDVIPTPIDACALIHSTSERTNLNPDHVPGPPSKHIGTERTHSMHVAAKPREVRELTANFGANYFTIPSTGTRRRFSVNKVSYYSNIMSSAKPFRTVVDVPSKSPNTEKENTGPKILKILKKRNSDTALFIARKKKLSPTNSVHGSTDKCSTNTKPFLRSQSDNAFSSPHLVPNSPVEFYNVSQMRWKAALEKLKTLKSLPESTCTDVEEATRESSVSEIDTPLPESTLTKVEEPFFTTVVSEVKAALFETPVVKVEEPFHETTVTEVEAPLLETNVTKVEEPIHETTIPKNEAPRLETTVTKVEEPFHETTVTKVEAPLLETTVPKVQEAFLKTDDAEVEEPFLETCVKIPSVTGLSPSTSPDAAKFLIKFIDLSPKQTNKPGTPEKMAKTSTKPISLSHEHLLDQYDEFDQVFQKPDPHLPAYCHARKALFPNVSTSDMANLERYDSNYSPRSLALGKPTIVLQTWRERQHLPDDSVRSARSTSDLTELFSDKLETTRVSVSVGRSASFAPMSKKDTPSPSTPIDQYKDDTSDRHQLRHEERVQKDRSIDVYPETLRQRQRSMAPSPSKVDIKNWNQNDLPVREPTSPSSGKKFLPSVKALRSQFETGKAGNSGSSNGSISPVSTFSNSSNGSGATHHRASSRNDSVTMLTRKPSGSSLASSSLEKSSSNTSLNSAPSSENLLDGEHNSGPVEPIFCQFQKVDEELRELMSRPTSTSGWDPRLILKRLYFIPEMPRTHSKGHSYTNIEGLLEKLPSGRKKATFWNAWKKRYFVAKDGVLCYYQNSQCDKPSLRLTLMGGKVETMEANMVGVDDGPLTPEDNAARILSADDGKGHYVVMRCSSRSEAERWRKALETHLVEDFASQYVQPHPMTTNPTLLRDTLIIDIGSCSVRAGVLASQATLPQIFFPTVLATDRESRRQIWGAEALSPEVRSSSSLSFPIRPSHRISKYTVDLNAVSSLLSKVFSELKVDARNYNLQISAPRILNQHTQSELIKILFEKFGVKGVNITHQSILALYAYNATSGIVVDIGERMDIVPVTDGYIIEGGVSRVPYGGHRILDHIRQFLHMRNVSLVNDVETYLIRHVLENACYCALHYNTEKARCTNNPEAFEKSVPLREFFPGPTPAPYESVELDFGRFQATEGLFNPDAWGLDHPGLHKLVHKAILECSMDIRKEMSRSIFLAGGVTQLPGLADRLTAELDNLTPPAIRPKVHVSPYRYHAAFIGACTLAESPAFTQSLVTKENWMKNGNAALRKWTL